MTDRDEMVRVVAKALRQHSIECTGLGEVTCRCREGGWMFWNAYYAHQAAVVVDALGERLAQAWDEGVRAHRLGDDIDGNPYRTDPREG